MLKPGVVMRSASRAAESSAVSRLIPEDDGEEAEAMGEEADATPRLGNCDLLHITGPKKDGETCQHRCPKGKEQAYFQK